MELVLANNRRPRLQKRPRPLPMGGKYDPPSSEIYFGFLHFSLSFFYFFSGGLLSPRVIGAAARISGASIFAAYF